MAAEQPDLMNATETDEAELHFWLAEHERTLDWAKDRISTLERAAERERDLAIPHAIAAGGIFAMPLALSLPWLMHANHDQPTSGWTMLLAPGSAPLIAGLIYLVATGLLLQGLALVIRSRGTALAAAIVTVMASLATIGFLFTVAHDSSLAATTGPAVSLVVLLILGTTWGMIAELRAPA